MNNDEKEYLRKKANEIRRLVLRSAYQAGGGHIAPAYSCVEIVTTLYFGGSGGVLRHKANEPEWIDRDYFIMSKGHGALTQYAALALDGYFPVAELDTFSSMGSELGSLASIRVPGVEATTGSLGHGLSFGAGIALSCKMSEEDNRVYVLVGDGECEEGSIWETLIAAHHYQLNNLVVIVDCNRLQAMDSTKDILSFTDIGSKAKSFGLDVIEIDGHDFEQIYDALTMKCGNPLFIVAKTIKGKGLSFMENVPIWHYRIPDDEELKVALNELGMPEEELGIKHGGEKVYI